MYLLLFLPCAFRIKKERCFEGKTGPMRECREVEEIVFGHLPKCSFLHLLGYLKANSQFFLNGKDAIVKMSVYFFKF